MIDIKVNNKLNVFILGIKMTSLENGKKVKIKEIEEDIAKYCGVSRDMIVSIKSGRVLPSLMTALRLAEYFKVNVNDIFYLGDRENE